MYVDYTHYNEMSVDFVALTTATCYIFTIQTYISNLTTVTQLLTVQAEYDTAIAFLDTEMGLHLKDAHRDVSGELSGAEISTYIKRFKALDSDNKGFITVNDLRRYFKVSANIFRHMI